MDGQVHQDLADLSACELGQGYRSGAFTPVDALEAVFDRMDRMEPILNAFVHQDRRTSRLMAESSAARFAAAEAFGPLDGIPVSVKDLSPVAGWPNRRGSRALLDDPPAGADAPPVARLREAGAVFIGKTATPESGSRIVTRSSVHGVTANPHNPALTPGGSSGGAAAALASGMGALATGTDGAGSIRIPAAFCGVFGLKPGFGRVPSYPPSHFMPHAVTGPMARTAEDLAAMAAVMCLPDRRDPFAWPLPFGQDAARAPVAGLRIAVSDDLGVSRRPEPSVVSAIDRIAGLLQDAGAEVVRSAPEWPVDPSKPFGIFWTTSYAGFLDLYPPDKADLMDPLLHSIAEAGRRVDTSAYHRALNDRLAITAAAHAFLSEYDAILCPSVIGPAFDIEADAPPGEEPDDWSWSPYCYIFNMTGQPAVAVPAGHDESGRPVGVQIAARAGREELLIALARACEARGAGFSPPQPQSHGRK